MSRAYFTFRLSRFIGLLWVTLCAGMAQVEGPGGHFYKVVLVPSGISWNEAQLQAASSTFNGLHGYLATITSADEDTFIEGLRQEAAPGNYGSLWVGGSQLETATSPTDGWFWVNGEGPIPIPNGSSPYANWQLGEPNDYWGPQSEKFLSVGHFNTFGWNDEPDDLHILGYVVEYPGRGIASTVKIVAVDPIAAESAIPITVDAAEFEISRDGDLSLDLPVFYSIHGTAVNGVDYDEIAHSVIIPAQASSVRLRIVPRSDLLTVVEPMETVGIRLEPSLILTPTAAYNIDAAHREAAAVIYEGLPPLNGALEIALPANGFIYKAGEPVTILAALCNPLSILTGIAEPITLSVDFYADDSKIGSASQVRKSDLTFFNFTWPNPPAGPHILKARATTLAGLQLVSSPIQILIPAVPEFPKVAIRFVDTPEVPRPDADFAPGYFEVTRTGSTAQNLQVFYTVGGSATADADYEALQGYAVIGAGRSSAKFTIVASDDLLNEPNETVVLTLVSGDPADGPPAASPYFIDPEHNSATATIFDNDPAITITAPYPNEYFSRETTIIANAAGVDPNGFIQTVELLANDLKVAEISVGFSDGPPPVGMPIPFSLTWPKAPSGDYQLTIRGHFSTGKIVTSDPVPVRVLTNSIPIVSINIAPEEMGESGSNAESLSSRVTLSRTGNADSPLAVYLNYEGTAMPNQDYARALTQVTIPAGSLSFQFDLLASADSIDEDLETAIVRLAPPPPLTGGAQVGSQPYEINSRQRSARVDILDDLSDSPLPVVSIWPMANSIREGNGGPPAAFALRRSGPPTNSLTVYFSYLGNNDNDYPTLGRSIQFPAGLSEIILQIFATDDQLVEGDETFMIAIDDPPEGAGLVGGSATAPKYQIDPSHTAFAFTIHDNDTNPVPGPAVVRVMTPDPVATEFPPNVDAFDPAGFLVQRTGDSSQNLQVFYSLHGTAKNGEDYQFLSDSVIIPAGKESVEIRVTPLADTAQAVHQYKIVSAPGISWAQARLEAEQAVLDGVQGHLATITSADEDALIESLRVEAGGPVLWVGGYQEADEASITEGWKWVNNEGSIPGSNSTDNGYANWLSGEPNDYWGVSSENQMVIGWLNSFGWNDQGANVGAQGYVVEFDVSVPEREPMETVAIRLENSTTANPLPGYTIDPEHHLTGAIIFDQQPPASGAVEIAFPSAGGIFQKPSDVEFLAAAFHPTLPINELRFFVDGRDLGSSAVPQDYGTLKFYSFKWAQAISGHHVLQAKTTPGTTPALVSSEIPFVVEGNATNQSPVVTITQPSDGAAFVEGDPIEIRVKASDPDGTIASLELVLDGSVVAATNGPSLFFILKEASVGPHTAFARALDNLGGLGLSPAVNILVRHPDTVAFVRRHLPASYSPGLAFTVELRAEPPGGTHACAVEDRPPAGWQVSDISHDGAFDSATGKVKFGPFLDAESRTLTYRLTPPANASGRYEFAGDSSVNGALYPIVGDNVIQLIQQYHPADQNRSFSIVLAEITAYAAAWKAGDSWPTGPVPIPLSYVTSAGSIWKRGETYHFEPARPAPACWVPGGNSVARVLAANALPISTTDRAVPGELKPGAVGQIQIPVTPPSGTACYALEEKPPYGWIVSNISHNGTFDSRTGIIRWGPFFDNTPRAFSYTIAPPAGVSSVGAFAGQLSIDGQLSDVSSSNSAVFEGADPIQITQCRLTSTGTTLQITGPAGQTAVIERSTNFTDWTELQSIFIPSGGIEFTDESKPAGSSFYRLRVQ